jgi:hypothetical protein
LTQSFLRPEFPVEEFKVTAAAAFDILMFLVYIALSVWERRSLKAAAAPHKLIFLKVFKLLTLLLIILTTIKLIYTF